LIIIQAIPEHGKFLDQRLPAPEGGLHSELLDAEDSPLTLHQLQHVSEN